MFHTEFYKGKSLQEVNAFDSEGAVLNIIIDGKWRERERERERERDYFYILSKEHIN